MNKRHDDEFTDDELREMEAALHLIHAQRHALDGAAEHDESNGEDGGDEKISKEEARYRPGTASRHCEICSMFLDSEHDNKNGDGKCTLVEGPISPQGLCDYFERQKGRAVGGSTDHDRRVHYERVKGVAEPGSFKLPHHAVHKLGGGDGRTAGKVLRGLFGVDPEAPDIIPAETVHRLGGGDLKAGHRVLNKFLAMLRRGKAQSRDDSIPQPDRHHGRIR
jgi:hypothetical protein